MKSTVTRRRLLGLWALGAAPLLVAVADQVATVDTLKAAQNEEQSVLWRESLTQAVPDLTPQPAKSLARYVSNPLDPASPPKNYLADAGDRPLGRMGPVTHRGVYYQKVRTLICAGPLTGRVSRNGRAASLRSHAAR